MTLEAVIRTQKNASAAKPALPCDAVASRNNPHR
jgi:hypothetical protein